VEAISGGKFHVPHFTGKAKVDRIVKEAGFPNHTFVFLFVPGRASFAAALEQQDKTLIEDGMAKP